jgi:hypothetical protein
MFDGFRAIDDPPHRPRRPDAHHRRHSWSERERESILVDARGAELVVFRRWEEFHREALGFMPTWDRMNASRLSLSHSLRWRARGMLTLRAKSGPSVFSLQRVTDAAIQARYGETIVMTSVAPRISKTARIARYAIEGTSESVGSPGISFAKSSRRISGRRLAISSSGGLPFALCRHASAGGQS